MDDEPNHQIPIRENYRDWRPPLDASNVVRKLIDVVPNRYLIGLTSIVLTNSGALNRRRRRAVTSSRGTKVRIPSALGLYHRAFRGEPAWIELFIDNIVRAMPKSALWIPVARDLTFGDVIFHELGHHIHSTQAPEYREREDVADTWERKLTMFYVRRHLRYLIPIGWIWWKCLKPSWIRLKSLFASA